MKERKRQIERETGSVVFNHVTALKNYNVMERGHILLTLEEGTKTLEVQTRLTELSDQCSRKPPNFVR